MTLAKQRSANSIIVAVCLIPRRVRPPFGRLLFRALCAVW